MGKTLETIGVLIAAIALDVITANVLGPEIGATAAAIIGGLAAAGVTALGNILINPPQKRTLSLREALASHKLIYGQMKVGGAITFVDMTSDNQTLFMVVTIAGHPVFSIDGIYLNDTYVPLDSTGAAEKPNVWPDGTKPTNYKNHVVVAKGTGTVTGDKALLTALGAASQKWQPNFFQYGRAKIYVRIGWNTNLFSSTGVPNISAVIRGRMVLDPRDTPTTITSSSGGSPGQFLCNAAHGLNPGDMVFIRHHVGALPVSQPWWPEAQVDGVAQEYEIATTPTASSFTVYGPDSNPLVLSRGGSGGTVVKMQWSDNSALCLNDYLVEPMHGMGVIYDTEVDETLLIANSNLCDEIVPRYLPVTTFTAQPSPINTITYVENTQVGTIPSKCEVILSSSGSLPGGLNNSTVYFFGQAGGGPVGALCSTAVNAAKNPPNGLSISSTGSGIQTITVVEALFNADPTTSSFEVYNNSLRLTTGTEVTVHNFGGSLPAGLTNGGTYFIIFLSDIVIQLASTLENARLGIPIAFTGTGDGTPFIEVVAEARYTCNGWVDTSENRQSIIQKMLSSMAGYLVPSGVNLNIYPAQFRTPAVTLDETDLRGPIQLTALQSGTQSFNSVKGTFIDPFNRGQATDYPYYQNQTYVQQDNFEVVWRDLNLEFTNSSSMAQRLAKIYLERVRRELTVKMPLKLTAFRVGSPDVILVDNAMWGWVGEEFEVSSWSFSIGPDQAGKETLNCDITARQTDAAVFAWTAAEEAAAKRQTNTNLPNPFVVQPPSNLTLQSGGIYLVQQQDGTIVSRILVSWTSPPDQFVLDGGFIDIAYQVSGSNNWQFAPSVSGDATFGFIENAAVGTSYDIAVRSRNAIGALSDTAHPWSAQISGYVVQGKTNAPSDIATLAVSENGMTVILAGSPITDTDVVVYEYRFGAARSWSTMTVIEQAAAVPNGSGGVAGSCTTGSIPAGTWWFAVKALNRSGIYSVNAAFAQSTVFNAINGSTQIIPGTLGADAFAAGIAPIFVYTSLPGTGSFPGQLAVLYDPVHNTGQLFVWTGLIWTLDVPAVSVTGQLTAAQIQSITAAQLTGQITTTQITPGAVTTPLLAAGAVNTAALAAGSVTTAVIASGAITTATLAAGAVTSTKIAAATITSGNLAANAIQAGQIAAGAINVSTLIANNVIITGHLVANTVTNTISSSAGLSHIPGSASPCVAVVISTNGGLVLLNFSDWITRISGGAPFVTYQLQRIDGGGLVHNFNNTQAFGTGAPTYGALGLTYEDNPAAGTYEYLVTYVVVNGGCDSNNPFITATEIKR